MSSSRFFLVVFFLFLALSSLCLVLLNFFSHSSLQTFLFHSFGILFRCDIVLFSVLPLLILRFSISQSCYCFFPTCSHSHREIRTNMHDNGTTRNALSLLGSCCTGRTCRTRKGCQKREQWKKRVSNCYYQNSSHAIKRGKGIGTINSGPYVRNA